MPVIQVIPTTKAKNAAPGWAYVYEPVIDPSRMPLNADGGPRSAQTKRAAAKTATDIIIGANTKSQASRVRARLLELGKDNGSHSEVAIPDAIKRDIAEARWKIGLDKKGGGAAKMSPNVRKILGSEKNWAHHVADVQAELELSKQNETSDRRKAKATAPTTIVEDVEMVDAEDEADEEEQSPTEIEEERLLQVVVPQIPSQAVLEALVKGPPLTYAVAAAGESTSKVPLRRFCAMCGYWGKIRCTFCGDFVCGLNCKRIHDTAEHGR
jgi:zinc finger HIT domain-containing protein 1